MSSSNDGISVLGKEVMLFVALVLIGLAGISIPAGWPIWLTFVFAFGAIIGASLRMAFHLNSTNVTSGSVVPSKDGSASS